MLDQHTATRTVILIDDHPLMRAGMTQLLEQALAFQVVAEAADGYEGLRLVRQHKPDLLILDLEMPGLGGLSTLEAIRADGLTTRVIVCTVSDREGDVLAAMRAGADGYLLKDMAPLNMLDSIRSVAEGHVALGERLTEVLARGLRHEHQPVAPASANLTERESEILRLLADGASNKLIARRLDIAETTVKVHVKRILKKLNLNSRVEAAVWVTKNNFR